MYSPPFTVEGHELYPSTATTATHSTAFKRAPKHVKGVRVWIVSTAETSTASVTFDIEVKHPLSATYKSVLTSAAVEDASTTLCLDVYPGSPTVTNVCAGRHIGAGFRVTATHADSDSLTYSIAYQWLF